MVYVYMASCSAALSKGIINEYLPLLPGPVMERARAFRFESDYCRYLLGKILLLKGMAGLGYPDLTLSDLQVNEFSKPYFTGCPQFNITHSGDYVLCALSKECTVGIDIEEIRALDITEFSKCFTSAEWSYINNITPPLQGFYHLWTRKEAIIKADGRGLQIPLLSFEAVSNKVSIGAAEWFVNELAIDDKYCAHLATNTEIGNRYSVLQVI